MSYMRKHQKAILVVMGVVCMITFVVGPYLLDLVSSGTARREDPVVATWKGGRIERSKLEQMRTLHFAAVNFLQNVVQEARERGGQPIVNGRPITKNDPFVEDPGIPSDGGDESIVHTMLLAERAEQLGIAVDRGAVQAFLTQLSAPELSEADWRNIAQNIGDRHHLSVDQVFEQVAYQLRAQHVRQLSQAGLFPVPPGELWEYHNRLYRRATIEAFPVKVEPLISQVSGKPTDAQIMELFNDGRAREPNPALAEPGFRRPHRVAFEYFRVDFGPFLEEAKKKITEQQIVEQYEKGKAQGKYKVVELPGIDAEKKPDDPKPDDAKPDDSKPDAKPDDSKPDDAKPDEKKSGDKKSDDKKSDDKKSDDKKSDDKKSDDKKSDEGKGDDASDDEKVKKDAADEKADPAPCSDEPDSEETDDAKSDDKKSDDKKSDEEPAEPKPADSPKPADAKAEDAKPAADKPATDKPATETPATDKPATETPAPPPKFKTLEEVREEIRTELAQPIAQEARDAAVKKATLAVSDYGRKFRRWADAQEFKRKPKGAVDPGTLNIQAIASQYGFKAGSTPLVDRHDVGEYEIGQKVSHFDFSGGQVRFYTFADMAFGDNEGLYNPTPANSMEPDVTYMYWRTKEEAAAEVTLEEVRPQVVEAWKKKQAFEVAKADAQKIVDKAKKAKALKEVVGQPANVIMPPPFSWLTTGSIAAGFGQPSLSNVDGVSLAGEEFMRAVFELKPGQTGVAPNQAHTVVYVVRMVAAEPTDDVLREQFLESGASRETLTVASREFMQTSSKWYEDLEQSMDLVWHRQPGARSQEE